MDIYSVSKRGLSYNKSKKNTRRMVKRTKRMRTKRMRTKRNSKRVSRRRNVKNVKRKSRRQTKRRVNRRSRRVMRGGRPLEGLDLARDHVELAERLNREAPSDIFRTELELFAPSNAKFIMKNTASDVAEEIISSKRLDRLGIKNDTVIRKIVREKRDELEDLELAQAAEAGLKQRGDEAAARAAAMEKEEMQGSTMTMKQAWELMEHLPNGILTDIYSILNRYKDILRLDESPQFKNSSLSPAAAIKAYMTVLEQQYLMGATEKKILAQIINGINGEDYTKKTRRYLMRNIEAKLG